MFDLTGDYIVRTIIHLLHVVNHTLINDQINFPSIHSRVTLPLTVEEVSINLLVIMQIHDSSCQCVRPKARA